MVSKGFWILFLLGLFASPAVIKGDTADTEEYEEYVEDGNDDDDKDGLQPIITTVPKPIDVVEGDDILLECKGKHLDGYAIIWTKVPDKIISVAGDTLNKNESHRIESIEKETVLVIKNSTLSDSGQYNCTVQWNVTIVHSVIVRARERKMMGPYITLNPSGHHIVDEGDNVNLTCTVRTEGKQMGFEWQKKNQHGSTTIKVEETTRPSKTMAEHVLMLKTVSRHDAGDYICVFQDDLGKAESTVRLEVNFSPVIETKHDAVHSAVGKDLELRCVVHGKPKPTLTWYKNDKNDKSKLTQIVPRSGYQMRSDHHTYILFITSVKESDFGTYTCEARNGFPRAGVAVIDVVGSPSQPVIVADKTGMGKEFMTYNLVWKVESSVPIESNAVKYKKDSGDWTDIFVEATRTHNQSSFYEVAFTLRDLSASSTYEVTLVSKNKFGWSIEARPHRFPIKGSKYDGKSLELNDGKGKASGTLGNGLLISASISVFLVRRW